MNPPQSHSARAFPKINLLLTLNGKRPDGYHDITTLFLPIDAPSDTISISPATKGTIEISSDNPAVPLDDRNTCHKAAALFAEKTNTVPAWKIGIEKCVPTAAGLGGGSADAAATLNLLRQLHPGTISDSETAEIACAVGADVPFFLSPRPAIGKGVGEILEDFPLPKPLHLLLLNPRFPSPTSWAYSMADTNTPPPPSSAEIAAAIDSLDFKPLEINDGPAKGILRNDLAPPVFHKFPIMGIMTEALKNTRPAAVGMSGSGPTLFAIFDTTKDAMNAKTKLDAQFEDAILTFTAKSEPTIPKSETPT